MPDIQGGYQERIEKAVNGMMASAEPAIIISREVETVAGAGFGLAVHQGAADHGVIIPTSETGEFIGITHRDVTLPDDSNDTYQQRDTAGIMREGVMWVQAYEAVVAGGPVTWNDLTGQLKTTAGVDDIVIVGARWETTASINTLAIVRLVN